MESAPSLDGRWTPVPVPLRQVDGRYQAIVACSEEQKFFRLTEGTWFMEEFEDARLGGWSVDYYDPAWEDHVSVEQTCGHLHVYGTWGGWENDRIVAFRRSDLVLADFAMSIDILGWDMKTPDERPNVGLVARASEVVGPSDGHYYMSSVAMRTYDDRNKSSLWISESAPAPEEPPPLVEEPFTQTTPTHDYRLVFSGVGSVLTVQLFDLTDGTPPITYQATDDTLTSGEVMFVVWERGPESLVDFWLDNFIVVGTAP